MAGLTALPRNGTWQFRPTCRSCRSQQGTRQLDKTGLKGVCPRSLPVGRFAPIRPYLLSSTIRMIFMHRYRSHFCDALRLSDAGTTARLSGWVLVPKRPVI